MPPAVECVDGDALASLGGRQPIASCKCETEADGAATRQSHPGNRGLTASGRVMTSVGSPTAAGGESQWAVKDRVLVAKQLVLRQMG